MLRASGARSLGGIVTGMPMSLHRKIIVGLVLTIVGIATYVGYSVIYTWRHIPEAYAAWDAGQLLVKYMQLHQDRWPTSWDDLLTVMNTESGSQMTLYGSRAGDTNYAFALRRKVAIDWKFDPLRGDHGSPVTRPNGTKFPIVWEGAEPNEMVHRHLMASITNAPRIR